MNHQLRLPADAWESLVHDLSHVDEARQCRIDAYLSEIHDSIQLSRSGESIFAQSDDLDEDLILSLLDAEDLPPKSVLSPGVRPQYSFQVQMSVNSVFIALPDDESAYTHPIVHCPRDGAGFTDVHHDMFDDSYRLSA